MSTDPLFGINIRKISFTEGVKALTHLAKNRTSSYACFVNVHMLMESRKDPLLASDINKADFSFADGKPLCIALRLLRSVKQERITGIDMMEAMVASAQKENFSVFLFGTTETELQKLEKALKEKYPALKIAGKIAPPYGTIEQWDNDSYIDQINKSGAHIVFISLGCPKQEKWAAKFSSRISAPCLAVGAAFAVHAHLVKRAPLFMRRFAMEWFFRWMQEPGRLTKRYLTTNTSFLLLLSYYTLARLFSRR